MKMVSTFLLAVLMFFSFGSCAHAADKLAIKEITPDNWEAVVAMNFALQLELPDGWTVKQAKSPNKFNNVDLVFTVGGDTDYAAFGDTLFTALQKNADGSIAKYGNVKQVYTSFADSVSKSKGISSFFAKLKGDGNKKVIINYFDGKGIVQLTIMRMGKW